MKTRLVLKVTSIFLIGLIIGAIGIFYYVNDKFKMAINFAIEQEVTSRVPVESFDAIYAYHFKEPELAIYALQHHYAFLELSKGKNFALLDDQAVLTDQAIDCARIALLYEKIGHKKMAKRYYTFAVDLYTQGGNVAVTKKNLIHMVNVLDDKFKKALELKGYGVDTPERFYTNLCMGIDRDS